MALISVRPAVMEDMFALQRVNRACLPENYQIKFFFYHHVSWPECQHIAEDSYKNCAGYSLVKADPQEGGHVTSLAVLRPYRKAKLATHIMRASQEAQSQVYKVPSNTLHVRLSNQGAVRLYRDILGFTVTKTVKEYYGDNEDAYLMRLTYAPTIDKNEDPSKNGGDPSKNGGDPSNHEDPSKTKSTDTSGGAQ